MNWSRAKTILIILFLCTNIFLLTTIILSSGRNSNVTEDIVASTVQILKENGVEISPDIIPRKTRILPVIDLEEQIEEKFITVKDAKKLMKKNGGEEHFEPVKNVASVLVDFISRPEHENKRIISLEQGYIPKTEGERQALVPSWKIVCENGKEFVLAAN